jgi:phage gp16-like protein
VTAARARPAVYDPAQQARRALLGRWHLLAKEKGLDEDSRRDRLERATGNRSAADCTDAELRAAIAELSGLRGPARPPRKLADSAVAKKARALWLSLWNLGVIRDSSEGALESFGARQLGVDRLQWADAAHADGLIEALKAMAEREGWSQKIPARTANPILLLKQRLALAQGRKLDIGPGDHVGLVLHEPSLDRIIAQRGESIRRQSGEG